MPLNSRFLSRDDIERSLISELSIKLPYSVRMNTPYIHAYTEALQAIFLEEMIAIVKMSGSRNRTLQLGLNDKF